MNILGRWQPNVWEERRRGSNWLSFPVQLFLHALICVAVTRKTSSPLYDSASRMCDHMASLEVEEEEEEEEEDAAAAAAAEDKEELEAIWEERRGK